MYSFTIMGRDHTCPSTLQEVTLHRLIEWGRFHSLQPSPPIVASKERKGLLGGFLGIRRPKEFQVTSHPSLYEANLGRMRMEVGYWLAVQKDLMQEIHIDEVTRLHKFIGDSLRLDTPANFNQAALAGIGANGDQPCQSQVVAFDGRTLGVQIRPEMQIERLHPLKSLLIQAVHEDGEPISPLVADALPVPVVNRLLHIIKSETGAARISDALIQFSRHFDNTGRIMPHLTIITY